MRYVKTHEGFIADKLKSIFSKSKPVESAPNVENEEDKLGNVIYDIVTECDPEDIEYVKAAPADGGGYWLTISEKGKLPVERLRSTYVIEYGKDKYRIFIGEDEVKCSDKIKKKIREDLHAKYEKMVEIMRVRRIKSKIGL